jgi:glycerol-3-phosphate dehydrogenase (NAD(P)+)
MPVTAPTSRVLVLGYGEMGHAMEMLLGARHRLAFWQRHPPAGQRPVVLEAEVPESDFILFCLPATAHAALATRLQPLLKNHTLCLTIAKGLDDAGRIPAEVLIEALGREPVAVAYGPMIAEEIRAGRAAYAQCSAASADACERLLALFHGSALRLEPSTDATGLSWSAILKNVYAIAFGLADELRLGDNVRGFLTVTALHELDAIVRALGGAPATPFHLAGLGDLVTTATSAGSHHHELGRRLARGETGLGGEGIHTLAVLRARPRFDRARFPLFRLIDACVQHPSTAGTRFPEFVTTTTA